MCDDTFTQDFESLVTYAGNIIEFNEDADQELSTPTSARFKSRSKQGFYSHFFMCKDHDTKKEWSTINGTCDKCILFQRLESFN